MKLLSGPSLGVFGSYYLVQVGFLEVIIWSKFVFLAYKNSGFKRFVLHTQLSFCVFFLSPIFWQFSKNSLFQKKGAKIGFLARVGASGLQRSPAASSDLESGRTESDLFGRSWPHTFATSGTLMHPSWVCLPKLQICAIWGRSRAILRSEPDKFPVQS